MDGLPVPLEALRVDECLGAEGAGVRSLAGVNEAVALEAGRVLVGLPTVPTLVGPEILKRFSSVPKGQHEIFVKMESF